MAKASKSPLGHSVGKTTIRLGKRPASSPTADSLLKKIKMTDGTSSVDHAALDAARPKRTPARPKRYSEASAQSDSLSPPRDMDATIPPKSTRSNRKSASNIPQKPVDSVATSDSDGEENISNKYSADFLMNYIDDEPESHPAPAEPNDAAASRPAFKSLKEAKVDTKTGPALRKDKLSPIDPRRFFDAEALIAKCLAGEPSFNLSKGDVIPETGHIEVPSVDDDETTMTSKLSTSLNALRAVGFVVPRNPVFAQDALDRTATTIISAATGGASTSSDSPITSTQPGTVDSDLRILIRNVNSILRGEVSTYTHLLSGPRKPQQGKSKRDPALKAKIESLNFAMKSLETLSASSALNVNRIIPHSRLDMMWSLYMALMRIIVPSTSIDEHETQSRPANVPVASSTASPTTTSAGIPSPAPLSTAAHSSASKGLMPPPPVAHKKPTIKLKFPSKDNAIFATSPLRTAIPPLSTISNDSKNKPDTAVWDRVAVRPIPGTEKRAVRGKTKTKHATKAVVDRPDMGKTSAGKAGSKSADTNKASSLPSLVMQSTLPKTGAKTAIKRSQLV